METLQSIFTNPIFAALAGWLAFNFVMLSMSKDEDEKNFALKIYFQEHWDNWVASLFMIPVLLFFGYSKLNITIDANNLEWSDMYYPCSGFFTELVKVAYKKWKAKNQ